MANMSTQLFTPTLDEITNLSSYIEKVRPLTGHKGLCRIKLPSELCINSKYWQTAATYSQFGQMAEIFKMEFFGRPASTVTDLLVETEFWQQFSTPGNNLAGFLAEESHYNELCLNSELQEKNLPAAGYNTSALLKLVEKEDIVKHCCRKSTHQDVVSNVSMCFSYSPWQTDANWGYYLSYLHWGDNKTWYVLSGDHVDEFEESFGSDSKHGFISPQYLTSSGFIVATEVQHAGELVVVFPRTYRAWLSHGFNHSESFSFLPEHWIYVSLNAMEWSKKMQKPCQFSFEEVICDLSTRLKHVELLPMLESVLRNVIDADMSAQQHLISNGMKHSQHFEGFELIPVAKRRCSVCRSVCFLSAVFCECSPGIMACCHHAKELCSCRMSDRCLVYRYSAGQLSVVVEKFHAKVTVFTEWSEQAARVLMLNSLDSRSLIKPDLSHLMQLETIAKANNLTTCCLYRLLADTIHSAQDHSLAAHNFIESVTRSCQDDVTLDWSDIMSFDELQDFVAHIKQLRCNIPEADQLFELFGQCEAFKNQIVDVSRSCQLPTVSHLEHLFTCANSVPISLPDTASLDKVFRSTSVRPPIF